MPPIAEGLKPETVIDISHESLMRVWQRLIQWADEEAQSAQTYRRLAETSDLHQTGKANLLRDPELQLALDWRESTRPNQPWASRHPPGFATAMRFLAESGNAREAEWAERENQRRREQEFEKLKAKTRFWMATGAGVVAALALLFAVVANEARSEASAALNNAQLVQWRSAINTAAANPDDGALQILLALEFLPDAKEKYNPNVDLPARLALAEGIDKLRERSVFAGHLGNVGSVAVTPDGSRIVTTSDDQTVRIWDVQTGTSVSFIPKEPTGPVLSVAVTPDGSRIVTGATDRAVRILDSRSGDEVLRLKGHTGVVTSVAVTPDGSRIVTGSDDNTARVWDARSGDEVL